MKLPKNFGGQGFQGMLAQAQAAMSKAQNLDAELATERFDVDKGPIKCVFNGLGELQSIKIDPSVIDTDDMEMLEDLIVSSVRDGFAQATEQRDSKVREIMPDVPGMDQLGL